MNCQMCGKPIAASGGPGRSASYCSQACRQRAYRERRSPGRPVEELISDIAERAGRLRPTPAEALHADVEALSTRFTQLRRLARQAREENVTPEVVTKPGEDTFTALIEQHRAELRAHCYRLLGSYDEAEDLTQETFLRAWRSVETLGDLDNPRAWLYKIATNVCLDFLRKQNRAPSTYEPIPGIDSGDGPPPPKVAWLQPYPDDQLPERAAVGDEPDEQAVASETLELVFLTAIQHLPPRQRAAVILRDVARWSAEETAELLGSTPASANSAVQRGRAALRAALPERREDWSAVAPTDEDRALLQRYMEAALAADIDAMAELVRADAVLTMPPNPFWFTTREALLGFVRPNLDPESPRFAGHWRHLPTRANGQLAVAGYLQCPGTTVYRAQLLDVLRFDGGQIAQITTFEPHHFTAFGLPMTL
ncbi:RNA polymerase subunit sigma-70 [Kribbella sp. DT2]|uniref:RNA polymerase subunit sigma-70 n=1 Tax=Kribbella sp. DT2 TaxID=3393427 RepID=UPI003CF956AD